MNQIPKLLKWPKDSILHICFNMIILLTVITRDSPPWNLEGLILFSRSFCNIKQCNLCLLTWTDLCLLNVAITWHVFWNLLFQCDELVELGASIGETPAAVVKKCKYTIAMLSDPCVALSVSNSHFGFDKHFFYYPFVNTIFWFRWLLTKMVFLNKFALEKVTLTCQLLMLILLQRLMRYELHACTPYVCSEIFFWLTNWFGVNRKLSWYLKCMEMLFKVSKMLALTQEEIYCLYIRYSHLS